MKNPLLVSIHIVFFGDVRIVSNVFPFVDLHHMRARVFALFNLLYRDSPANIFPGTNLVAFVPASWAIIIPNYFSHLTPPFCDQCLNEYRKQF